MSTILINPPWIERDGNIWQGIASQLPSLGLGYIASVLEQHNIDVKILDAHAERMNYQLIEEYLKKNNFEWIGLTASTPTIRNALEVAKIAKRINPSSKIVIGGVHATVMPDEVLANDFVDYVITGEGEYSMRDLVSGKKISEIPGLVYRDSGKNIHNPPGKLIEHLDDIPFPAYHKMPMKKYYPALGNYKRLPATSILGTRGCPGRCTFCYKSIFGIKVRFRSPENIIEEIKLLQKDYGIKEISFYDDTFTASKKNVHKFCEIIQRDKIDLTWECMSRVDYIDEELLRAMKKAGCHQICYGVESANEKILENIKKKTSISLTKDIIKLTKKVGIDVRIALMLGNPGDTEETMQESIDFAIETDPDIVVFNVTTPYPGTEMYGWAKQNGYLITEDWTKYDVSQAVMNLPTVSAETVNKYYKLAYKKFYNRPSYIIKRLLKIRNWNDVKVNFQAFKSVMKTIRGSKERLS